MLVISCITIGVVCVVAVSRRTAKDSQTHSPLWMPRSIVKRATAGAQQAQAEPSAEAK